jgi:D-glycero-D-manno-heptose 1,7-bisphosphate phosphatase
LGLNGLAHIERILNNHLNLGLSLGTEIMRAVFLDRDGVINKCIVVDGKPFPPSGPDTFELIPETVEACARLKQAGFALIVVTNQPDIGRGTQKLEVLEAMHQIVKEKLPVDAIYVCTHGSDNECHCRKPKPGMLTDAATDLEIELETSFMVGDRWRDVDCGHSAGCRTVFIDYGYDEKLRQTPDATVKHLGEAADWILSQKD